MTSLEQLAAALRADPPASFSTLTTAEQQRLAEAVSGAISRQAEELDAAAERGLAFVPRILRGPVKRLLF